MANTLILSLALDNTSTTTFKAWAGVAAYNASTGLATSGGIAYALTQLGMVQTTDTGQVVWIASVFTSTVTGVVVTGGNSVYTYTSQTSGPLLRVGMSITTSGFGTGGNNVTGNITAVTGSPSAGGTFTLATTTQSTQTGQTASATTTVSTFSVTTTNRVFEVWKFNDAFVTSSPVIMKIEYGNSGAAAHPNIFVTFGSATDGAGTITGTQKTAQLALATGTTTNDTAAYNQYFCGTSSRFAMSLDDPAASSARPICFLNVERSLDSSGNTTGSYFTVLTNGIDGTANTRTSEIIQQSIVIGLAGNPPVAEVEWLAIVPNKGGNSTWTYNSTTMLSVVTPFLGVMGNPLLGVLVGKASDWLDQTSFSVTVYAQTHTYLVMGNPQYQTAGSFVYQLAGSPGAGAQSLDIMMRFE